MKNKPLKLFTALLVITSFSCNTDKAKNSDLEKLMLGDPLLKNESIVDQINKTCTITGNFFERSESETAAYNKNCVWYKLTYDYMEISAAKKVRELFNEENVRLYIQNFPSTAKNALLSSYSYLFIEKNNGIKDSILIFKEDQYDEALFVSTKVFFLENNSLITMEVEDDESGSWVKSYIKYKIDLDKGKFIQTFSKHPKRKVTAVIQEHTSDNRIAPKYHGTFSASVQTEATTTGMASIEYTFSVTEEGVNLTTNTYHEPIRCNGNYAGVEKDQVLELFFTGDEESCDTENPSFYIKEKKGDLYIKGLGSEGTYNDWIKLKKN